MNVWAEWVEAPGMEPWVGDGEERICPCSLPLHSQRQGLLWLDLTPPCAECRWGTKCSFWGCGPRSSDLVVSGSSFSFLINVPRWPIDNVLRSKNMLNSSVVRKEWVFNYGILSTSWRESNLDEELPTITLWHVIAWGLNRGQIKARTLRQIDNRRPLWHAIFPTVAASRSS